jgi:hypothetical protein
MGKANVFLPAGRDLLGLIVTTAEDGTVVAQHDSHYSHSSHASHRSHYSSNWSTTVAEIVIEFGVSQSSGALKEAAYRLIGEASCLINTEGDRHICRLTPKGSQVDEAIRTRFLDLVTDENLREKISAQTAPFGMWSSLSPSVRSHANATVPGRNENSMAGFRDAAAYSPAAGLQLLPLRFEQFRADRYLVNNFVGDGLLLTRQELDRIVSLDLVPGDGL